MEKFIVTFKKALTEIGTKHVDSGPNTVRFYNTVDSEDPRAEDWHLCVIVNQLDDGLAIVTVHLFPDKVENSDVFMEHIKDVATLLAMVAPSIRGVSLGLIPNSHDKAVCIAVVPTAISYINIANQMLGGFEAMKMLRKAMSVIDMLFPQLMDIVEGKISGFDAFYASFADAKKSGARVVCVNADLGIEEETEEEKPATPFGPGYFGPAGN